MKMSFFCKAISALMLALLIAISAFAAPWKFGIIADTQWSTSSNNLWIERQSYGNLTSYGTPIAFTATVSSDGR
jgi:hypothetical protein